MKRYLLYVLLSLVVLPACGQGVTDYYRAPEKSQQYKRLLTRYGGPQIRDRWYVAFDSFVKTDRAQLDNSFNGLLQSDLVSKVGWGVMLGWSYRERWMVEGGYTRMPIHTQMSVNNTNPPLSFRSTDNRSAFVLRGKRLLVSTSKPWLRSGFWLSGGMWVVPNSREQISNFSVTGYKYQDRWEAPESFQLNSQTYTNPKMTTLAELGVEYNVRLSNAFDLGISARKLWGLTNVVTTDVVYIAKRTSAQQAQLQGAGTGMTFGATLRYTYATRRNASNALNVQGKIGHIR